MNRDRKTNSVSIIIPAFNEGDIIGHLLEYLKANQSGLVSEIIVVDGGSTDQTREIAHKEGAIVILSPLKGRSTQMNLGADHAHGDILFFLHADSFPQTQFDQIIVHSLKANRHWGSFNIRFDTQHWLLSIIAWFTQFNFTFFMFGDQGLFVKKALFYTVGKFNPKQNIFEDTDISWRLGKHSVGIKLSKFPVITSARKFRENGVIRLTFIFLYLWLLYLIKTPQDKLLTSYKSLIIQNKI